MNMTTFNDIMPGSRLLKAIHELGFTEPTEIQAQTIPPALRGQDLIGQAKTGSGKTLVFGVAILEGLTHEHRPQALILAPTRELCQQIATELGKLARHSSVRVAAVYGGVSMKPQSDALRDSQIVVATPGRLLDHLERGTFRTESVHFLVFDEADRMFDMGFIKDMERIVKQLPRKRQTMLFSATMPEAIKRLTAQYQHSPVHIKTRTHVEEHLLPQFFYRVEPADKFSLLVHLLKRERSNLAMVFCQTKHGAKALARNLQKQGLDVDAMHGNLSQAQRDRVIKEFKEGKIRFLVATDVAARGLDVKHVTHIFNYNVPDVALDYIHRIGRTARAGASGKAITFVEPGDSYSWRDILRLPNVHATELRAQDVEPLAFHKHDRGPRDTTQHTSYNRPRPHSGGYRPAAQHGARHDTGHSNTHSQERDAERTHSTEGRTHFGDRPRSHKPSNQGGSRLRGRPKRRPFNRR